MELPPINVSLSLEVIKDRLALSFNHDPIRFVTSLAILLIIETLGNACLAIMIVYEKYGMDPQKRTINNQLLTHICALLIFNNLTVGPLMTIRSIFSALTSTIAALWCSYIPIGTLLYSTIVIAEMTLLKCMYIFAWPKMAMVDDDFMSTFLHRFNWLWTVLAIGSRLLMGEYETNAHYLMAKGEPLVTSHDNMALFKALNLGTTYLPIMTGYTILFLGAFVIGVKKLKHGCTCSQSHPPQTYNNSTHNENILSFFGILILGCFLLSLITPMILIQTKMTGLQNLFKSFFLFYSVLYIPSIILPLLFFIFKPKVPRSILEMLSRN